MQRQHGHSERTAGSVQTCRAAAPRGLCVTWMASRNHDCWKAECSHHLQKRARQPAGSWQPAAELLRATALTIKPWVLSLVASDSTLQIASGD